MEWATLGGSNVLVAALSSIRSSLLEIADKTPNPCEAKELRGRGEEKQRTKERQSRKGRL